MVDHPTLSLKELAPATLSPWKLEGPMSELEELREPTLSLWRLGHPMSGSKEVKLRMLSLSRLMGTMLDEGGAKDAMENIWDLGYPMFEMEVIKPLTWSFGRLGHLTLDLEKVRQVTLSYEGVGHPMLSLGERFMNLDSWRDWAPWIHKDLSLENELLALGRYDLFFNTTLLISNLVLGMNNCIRKRRESVDSYITYTSIGGPPLTFSMRKEILVAVSVEHYVPNDCMRCWRYALSACSGLLVSDLTLEGIGFDNVTMRVLIVSSAIIVGRTIVVVFPVTVDMMMQASYDANAIIYGTDAFDEFEATIHIGKVAFVDILETALGGVLVAKLRRAIDTSSYDSLRVANRLLWAAHVSVLVEVDIGTMMAFPEGSIHVLGSALDDMLVAFDWNECEAVFANCFAC